MSRGIVTPACGAVNISASSGSTRELVKFQNEIATRLETEIRDQGPALARREDGGRRDAARAAGLLLGGGVEYLLIAARGSSDNAARYGQYLLGVETGLSVALAAPWLYGPDRAAPSLDGAAVMAISQSGESPDVVGVLAAAHRQGRPTIAITNAPTSPLAEQADVVVDLAVGPELSVAATKTYTASLHALAQIAAAMRPDRIPADSLRRLPAALGEAVAAELGERERYDALAGAGRLTVIGRGLDFATACEIALKVRELSALATEGFSLPDFLHGPVAALDGEVALWMASSGPRAEPESIEAFTRLRARVGVAVAVSADQRLLDLADLGVAVSPALPRWAGPIVGVAAGQAAALRLAELRHADVDHPFGLDKVTLTQ